MKERTVAEWLEEILIGLEYRKIYGKEESWTKLELSYYNDMKSDAAVGPNIIYSQGDSLLSDLTVPDPEFIISPLRRSAVQSAPTVERLDNSLIDQLRLKSHVERASLLAYLSSVGILKIGYDSEWGWDPDFDIGELDKPFGITMTQFNKAGQAIEFNSSQPGMPWVSAVHPRDFVVPWGTLSLDDAEWCAHRVIRKTEYIKADPKYSNTGRLEPQMSMQEFMESYHYGDKLYRMQRRSVKGLWEATKKAIYNELWEIHDRVTRKVYVVCFTHDKFLRRDVDALQVAGLPFVAGSFVKHTTSFWTTPQAYYLGQSQKELFDISIQAAKQRRMNCLKIIALKDAFTQDELDKATSSKVGVVIKANKGPLKEIIQPVPRSNNSDLMMEAENSRRNGREALGYSRNQAGEFDASSRRTAYETATVAQGSEKRTRRRADVVSSLYIDAMKKVNQYIFSFWQTPRTIEVMPGEWKQFTGEEIAGEYNYRVRLATRSNLSKAQRKQEAIMMMAQLGQVPGVNFAQVQKYVEDAVNDPSFEGWFTGPNAMRQGGGMGGGGQQLAPTQPQQLQQNMSQMKPQVGMEE